jgi:hypothetical protein
MRLFGDLGGLIEERWRALNYNEVEFPKIAAQSLSEANLCDRVDPREILHWVLSAATLP